MKSSFFVTFKKSFLELRHVTTLVLTALFIGLAMILGIYTIQIGSIIKIGFTFIPIALTSFLFGPIVGGIMGGLTDILNFILKPTGPFFPGFTINAILYGIIYGMFFYKKPISLLRTFFAKTTTTIFINLFLSTLWLNILYQKAYIPLLMTRFVKEAVMLPIEIALLFSIMKSLEKANVFNVILKNNHTKQKL